MHVIGRLKAGVSLADAQVRMNALERQIAAQHPDTDAGNETWVEPLSHELTGGIRAPLLILLAAVGISPGGAELFVRRQGDQCCRRRDR